MSWGWPQYALATMYVLNAGVVMARFGQPKTDSYDFTDLIIAPGITVWLLYMGGFWQ